MSQIKTKTPKRRFDNQLRFRPDSRTIRELFALSITSFALYIPTLWCSFVADDEAEVLQDRLIRSFSNIPGFFAHSVWFFLNSGTGDRFYRPLKLLVYSIEYHLFQFHPVYWHFVNILLNTVVVVAAYFLVRDLAGHRLAFWTALWFAFHAIHVEPIAWIAAGQDLVCGLALVLATWSYHRARSGSSPIKYHCLAVVFFFAALLAKETALAFPTLLLAYDFLYRRDSFRYLLQGWRRYSAYFAALAAYVAMRWHALGGFAPNFPNNELAPKEIFLSVPILLAQYVGKTLFPTTLSFWYVFHPTRALSWKPLAAMALGLALLAMVLWLRRVRPVLSFGLAWFVLFLLPVLYIPKMSENVFTERYLYIPTIGFCLMAAWCCLWVLDKASKPLVRRAVYGGLILLFGFHASIIWGRLPDWQDDFSMALKTADQTPTAKNLAQAGYAYYQRGRLDDAIRYTTRANALNPNLAWIHTNLGSEYQSQGNYDRALAEMQTAIQLQPDFAPYWTNLGVFYRATGQLEKCIEVCRHGLKLAPDDHALLTILASALWRDGQDEAFETYRHAIRAEPDRLDAYISYATALYQDGELDAAIGQLETGLKANPEADNAYLVRYQLGAIYQKKGFQFVAAQEFRKASELKPASGALKIPLPSVSDPAKPPGPRIPENTGHMRVPLRPFGDPEIKP
jgi:tetratricopeptide (TPR) repeat protein